jgi:hypothetical protein
MLEIYIFFYAQEVTIQDKTNTQKKTPTFHVDHSQSSVVGQQ